VKAIDSFNHHQSVDVIVITRGGGSTDDLAAFNELALAQAISRSRIPIMTAIGHQSDNTLADKAACAFAITPTDAGTQLAKLAAGGGLFARRRKRL
jgi:exodeoxyribonuclease VII large subunit